MENEEMTLSERVASDLTMHPASHHKWAYHFKELPGTWVLVNGEDGSPKVLEYKNFRIEFTGTDWVATYQETGNNYPEVLKETPYPIVGNTLPEVYQKLLAFYKENEPITSQRRYDSWKRGIELRKQVNQEHEDDMKYHDGIPWNVRIVKGNLDKFNVKPGS